LENEFDFCARRAAEEFLAAGRAACPDERRTHRQLAERYAEVVRELLLKRANLRPAQQPQDDARAA
jgi:hypothetical protein